MPRRGASANVRHGGMGSVNDSRLRWYPTSWRARYGDELTALLDDEYGSSMPIRVRLSLASGGIRQRALQSGLTGDAVPAADGVRAGALVVLAAWTAFVIAGASFAKFAEHFDQALPHRIAAHRVPDLAFTVLQAVAGAACVLVAVGAALLVPAFLRFLRAGGWPTVSGHVLRAATCTVVTVAVTVPLVAWASGLPSQQPNDGLGWHGLLFLLWVSLLGITLTMWAVVTVAVGRRVDISADVLAAEAVLAAAVAAAMVLMVAATAVWWGAMAKDAPTFLSASPAGLPASPWDLWFLATMSLMLVAVGAATIGVLREARQWTTMRTR